MMQEHKLTRHADDRWSRTEGFGVPARRAGIVVHDLERAEGPGWADTSRLTLELIGWIGCCALVTCVIATFHLAIVAAPSGDANAIERSNAAAFATRALAPQRALEQVARGATHGGGSAADQIPPAAKEEQQVLAASAAAAVTGVAASLAAKAGSGQPFRDTAMSGAACPRCPELVAVPAGRFVMGASTDDAWREEWQKEAEGPPVEVVIGEPFAVGRFAVSFEEWDACVDDGGCAGFKPADNGWGRGNRPVINISWDNAASYVAWLSRKTGRPYRLLSETEREYVTRAGTTTPFWFGSGPSAGLANYLPGPEAGELPGAAFREKTVPVNSFDPNPWGLYNVHGNVWDWTADCWNANHSGHRGDGAARTTGECSHRVLRGGSWLNLPKFIRSAARNRVASDFRYKTIGFRVARSLGAGAPQ